MFTWLFGSVRRSTRSSRTRRWTSAAHGPFAGRNTSVPSPSPDGYAASVTGLLRFPRFTGLGYIRSGRGAARLSARSSPRLDATSEECRPYVALPSLVPAPPVCRMSPQPTYPARMCKGKESVRPPIVMG